MRKERRSEPRWRVEYLATMVSGESGPRYCVVTEMSEGGARIKTIIYRVPEEFGLRLTGQAIAKRYSVVWRNGRHVGACHDPEKSQEPSHRADMGRTPREVDLSGLFHCDARHRRGAEARLFQASAHFPPRRQLW